MGVPLLVSIRFQMLLAGNDEMRAEQAGFLPVLPIGVIGSYATDVCEPR
jgi:hypothetical protein